MFSINEFATTLRSSPQSVADEVKAEQDREEATKGAFFFFQKQVSTLAAMQQCSTCLVFILFFFKSMSFAIHVTVTPFGGRRSVGQQDREDATKGTDWYQSVVLAFSLPLPVTRI